MSLLALSCIAPRLCHTMPSWSLDVNETGESTKCLWVEAVGLIAYRLRGRKKRET